MPPTQSQFAHSPILGHRACGSQKFPLRRRQPHASKVRLMLTSIPRNWSHVCAKFVLDIRKTYGLKNQTHAAAAMVETLARLEAHFLAQGAPQCQEKKTAIPLKFRLLMPAKAKRKIFEGKTIFPLRWWPNLL